VATWIVKSPVLWVPSGVGVTGILTLPSTASVLIAITAASSTSISVPSDSAEDLLIRKLRKPTKNTIKNVAKKIDDVRSMEFGFFSV